MFRPKPVALVVFIGIAVVMLSSCAEKEPTITSFTPKEGQVGTEVTINGKNFKPNAADNTVKFGDTTATNILQASENMLVVGVPSGAKTAPISVTTAEGIADSKENFTVLVGEKWTFLVYLDADNNLESAGIDDFLEMADVGTSPDVNIVVQMDRTANYDDTFGDWTGTRRFLINKGDTPDTTPVSDLGEQNMGHPDTLQDFVTWAVQEYPAQRYALSIWNHGAGWRPLIENKLEPRALSSRAGEEGVTLRTVAFDDTDNDVLYMSEVQSALQSTQVKLDVVGFDACLMGLIEVAYALRNVASYVVGSEWLEPGDGWPYDTILAELISIPTFDGSKLSEVIVNKYGLAYSAGITQSAVDMAQLNNVVSKIDAFAAAMNTEWAALKTARGNTTSYHYWGRSGWGVDLWHFADNVDDGVTSAAIKTAAVDLKNAIDAFVVEEHHSSDKDGSHGVAIYFPPTQDAFDKDPDHTGYMQGNPHYPVDFVDDHKWDEFLKTYYANTVP